MLIQIPTAAWLCTKQEKTYMYPSENVRVTTIIRAARKMIEIRTDRNSDPHEYRLGLHEDKITLKNKGKYKN